MNARGLLARVLLPALLATATGAQAQSNLDAVRRYPPSELPLLIGQGEWRFAPWAGDATGPALPLGLGIAPLTDGSVGLSDLRRFPRPGHVAGRWGEPMWLPLPAPSMQYHTTIYDTRRHRIIAFGGAPYAFYDDYAGYPLSNRVWSLSLDGPPAWQELLPEGPAPSPRLGHSAAYDPVRDRMLIFGGGDDIYGAPPYRNDVWALSLSGPPVWSRLEVPGVLPPPRTGQCSIYDGLNDALVVFGSSGGGGYEEPLNDTWVLSLSDFPTWNKLEFSGPVPPQLDAGLTAYAAVFDPPRHRMVMVGRGESQSLEVWALTLEGTAAWTRLSALGSPPSTRVNHSCMYDPGRNRVVVFGGYAPGGIPLNDTWLLALAGTPTWTKLDPAGGPPSVRSSHAAAYDSRRRRLIVVGGWGNWEQGMDTWALSLKGPPAWSPVIDRGRPAWGRVDHTAVYDSAQERMLVFGGWSHEQGHNLVNTWTLSLSGDRTCGSLETRDAPGQYFDGLVAHSAIYDPARERMLVFGGIDREGRIVNGVWSLSLAGPAVWSRLETVGTPPAPRFAHRAILDPDGDRMVVFGGHDGAVTRNDVWALSLSDPPRWVELTPTQPGPAARAAHGLIHDPVRKRMIVFGGTDDHRLYDDTWALSLTGSPAWTPIAAVTPAAVVRRYPSAIYDPRSERMVIWGGSSHGLDRNDTWALSLAGPLVWTELAPVNESPLPRDGHTGLYDPVGHSMIIFGGGYDLNDTWALPLGGRRGCRARVESELELAQGSPAPGVELREPRPNPSAGNAEVEFTLPQSGQVSLAVYDAAGRSVRRLAEGPYAPGVHGLRWDGLDASGHPAPTGLYFMRLVVAGRTITRKAVVAR